MKMLMHVTVQTAGRSNFFVFVQLYVHYISATNCPSLLHLGTKAVRAGPQRPT